MQVLAYDEMHNGGEVCAQWFKACMFTWRECAPAKRATRLTELPQEG